MCPQASGQGSSNDPEPHQALVACQALLQGLPSEGAPSHREFAFSKHHQLPSQVPHTPEEIPTAAAARIGRWVG